MGPSDLILTRGTLDDEEEDSDTDDIDHQGKEGLELGRAMKLLVSRCCTGLPP